MKKRDRKVPRPTTSRGIPWAHVLVSDLPGMVQDGFEAAALLAAIEEKSKSDAAGDSA
jgi:hypothetical protein